MKRIIKNLILLILFFLFFGFLFTTPINHIGVNDRYLTPPSKDHQFDAQELNDFVLLWAKVEKSPIRKFMDQTLLDPEGHTSWFFKRWLKVNHWNDERFFYCQYRLVMLLRCVALEKNHQDNLKMAQSSNINLHEVISEQEKLLAKCTYKGPEYDLISKNFQNIINIIPPVIQKGVLQ